MIILFIFGIDGHNCGKHPRLRFVHNKSTCDALFLACDSGLRCVELF